MINMVITNLGRDTKVDFYGSCFSSAEAFNDEGNHYGAGHYSLDISVGQPGQTLVNSGYYTLSMPQEIPMKFSVKIKNVDKNASKIALLKIKVSCGDLGINNQLLIIRSLGINKRNEKNMLLLIVLLSIAGASAQVKFVPTDPNFKVILQRSNLAAKDVYVDMLFENTSDTDSELSLRPVDTRVYDDEGNVYSGHGKVLWRPYARSHARKMPIDSKKHRPKRRCADQNHLRKLR